MSVIERKLDACTVSVYPPLNPDHESLTVPKNMLSTLGILEKITNDGILLNGADMIYNYEQVCVPKVLSTYHQTYNLKLKVLLIVFFYLRICITQVLRQIQYSNKKPAYYLNRAFKLVCSEMNGRFSSNEYVQTVSFS